MESGDKQLASFYTNFFPKRVSGNLNLHSTLIKTSFQKDHAEKYLRKDSIDYREPKYLFPYIHDVLIRRGNLTNNISTIIHQTPYPGQYDYEVYSHELIVSYLHRVDEKSQFRILWYLVNAMYPLPLLYPVALKHCSSKSVSRDSIAATTDTFDNELGEKELFRLDTVLQFLQINMTKPIVLFLKTSNKKMGCSAILQNFFNVVPDNLNARGPLHPLSIDLFFTYNSAGQINEQGIVVDVHGWNSKDKVFRETIEILIKLSGLIVVNIMEKNEDNEKMNLKSIISLIKSNLNKHFGHVLVISHIPEVTTKFTNESETEFTNHFAGLPYEGLMEVAKIEEENKNPRMKSKLKKLAEEFDKIMKKIFGEYEKNKEGFSKIFNVAVRDTIMRKDIKEYFDLSNEVISLIDKFISGKKLIKREFFPLASKKEEERDVDQTLQLINQPNVYSEGTTKFLPSSTELYAEKNKIEKEFIVTKPSEILHIFDKIYSTYNMGILLSFERRLNAVEYSMLITLKTEYREQEAKWKEAKANYEKESKAAKDYKVEESNKYSEISNKQVAKEQASKILEKERSQLNEIRERLYALDASYSMYVQEIMALRENEKCKEIPIFKQMIGNFKSSFQRLFFEGYPMPYMKGNPPFIKAPVFDEILKDIQSALYNISKEESKERSSVLAKKKKISIISIIGSQSSSKSTLLNYLTGSHYPMSDGKCTKGINLYATTIDSTHDLIILDTEGLNSQETRNIDFEIQLAVFCMMVSHIVIINYKKEFATDLQNLILSSLFAYKFLRPSDSLKPKLLFVKRDQSGKINENQQQMNLMNTINQLNEGLKIIHSGIDSLVTIAKDSFFHFSNALISRESQIKGVNYINYLDQFSKEVLEFRESIFKFLGYAREGDRLESITDFYEISAKSWGTILSCGISIKNFSTVADLENRNLIRKITFGLVQNPEIINEIDVELKYCCDKMQKAFNKSELENGKIEFNGKISEKIQKKIEDLMQELKKTIELQNLDCTPDILENEKNYIQLYFDRIKEKKNGYIKLDYDKRVDEMNFEKVELKWNKQADAIDKKNSVEMKKFLSDLEIAKTEELKMQEKASQDSIKQADIINCLVMDFQTSIEVMRINMPDMYHITYISKEEISNPKEIKYENFFAYQGRTQLEEVNNHKNTIKDEITSSENEIISGFTNYQSISNVMKEYISKAHGLCERIQKKRTSFKCQYFIMAMKNLIHRIYMPKIYTRIANLMQEEQRKVSIIRDGRLNQIYERIKKKLDANADETAAKFIAETIEETIRKSLIESKRPIMSNRLNVEIERYAPNPEFLLKIAFKESFECENYVNVFKYIRMIDQFLEEILNSKIKSILEQFQKNTINEVKKLEEGILNNFIKDLESFPKKSTNDAFNDILEILKTKCPEVASKVSNNHQIKNITNHEEFLTYFIKYTRQCYDNLNYSKIEEDIKLLISNIDERFKRTIIDHCIGCKEKCKGCGAKCIKDANHKGGHSALHQLCAFNGWSYAWFYTPILDTCIETLKRTIYYDKGNSTGMIDYLLKNNKLWVEDLTGNPKMIASNEAGIKLLRKGWVNTRIPLQKYYNMVDFLPNDLKAQINSLAMLTDIPKGLPPIKYQHSIKVPNIDVVFLLDCTSSMGLEIAQAKKSIKNMHDFMRLVAPSTLQVGFVGYRDYPHKDHFNPNEKVPEVVLFHELTDNHANIEDYIETHATPIGGYDFAEAVELGLDALSRMNFRKDSEKFIYHILDAPPHGRQYHKPEILEKADDLDYFPDERPNKLNCEALLKELKENHKEKLHYCLITIERSTATELMKKLFKKALPEMFLASWTKEKEIDLVETITALIAKRVDSDLEKIQKQ